MRASSRARTAASAARTSSPRAGVSAARRAGTNNIIYVSIVGIDRIPLPYYKTKLRVEEALTASGIGHTTIRVTQFHDLIETMFSAQRFLPALVAIKGVRFQPIDTHDVATHLVSLIDKGPAGRVDDIGHSGQQSGVENHEF